MDKLEAIRAIVTDMSIRDPGKKDDYWGNEDDAEYHGFLRGEYALAESILKVLDE